MPTILDGLTLDRISAHLETERAERERIAAEPPLAGEAYGAKLEPAGLAPNRASWNAMRGASEALTALARAFREEIEAGAVVTTETILDTLELAASELRSREPQ